MVTKRRDPEEEKRRRVNELIGGITGAGAAVDSCTDVAIEGLLGLDRTRAHIVLGRMPSWYQRFGLLQALVKGLVTDDDVKKQFAELEKKLPKAMKERNNYVHLLWAEISTESVNMATRKRDDAFEKGLELLLAASRDSSTIIGHTLTGRGEPTARTAAQIKKTESDLISHAATLVFLFGKRK